MINEFNYHIATKGTFNIVSTNKLKSMFNAFRLQGFDVQTTDINTVFTFKDKEYKFNFVSFGKYGSMSIYFIVDNKQLLRISDHWSEGCKKLKVKKCKGINSCYWRLQGNSFPFYYHVGSQKFRPFHPRQFITITNCLLGGIINLNELKMNIKK